MAVNSPGIPSGIPLGIPRGFKPSVGDCVGECPENAPGIPPRKPYLRYRSSAGSQRPSCKAAQNRKSGVTLVRCRQVSKPRGAKAGLVHLSGDVRTVTVNIPNEMERLKRLELTKR
jgi:hypothetical protein